MKVTIKWLFGEVELEMETRAATELIEAAVKRSLTTEKESQAAESSTIQNLLDEKEGAAELAPAEEELPEEIAVRGRKNAVSRTEKLFGKKENWGNLPQGEPIGRDGKSKKTKWGGFMHLKCAGCGTVKTFCAKVPSRDYKCGCGTITMLKDLKRAKMICKCGKYAEYWTNLEDPIITINCVECNAPVDLELLKDGSYRHVRD